MKHLIVCWAALLISMTSAVAQTTTAVADCADARAQITRLETKLKDWPALGRYREANVKVAPRARDERRVVFMGDSITDNWNKPAFGGFFPARPYLDRGISGQTTPQMLLRFPADVIGLNPQVVDILAGTNDLAGNTGPTTLKAIEDNLAAMADLAKSKQYSRGAGFSASRQRLPEPRWEANRAHGPTAARPDQRTQRVDQKIHARK